MAKHASGVAVLAAPHEFEQAESIRSDDYQRVLEATRMAKAEGRESFKQGLSPIPFIL